MRPFQADSSDGVKVQRVMSQFIRTTDHMSSEKDREERNWKMYSGVNYGQWDASAVALLQSERRPVNTYNLVQNRVDTAVGILRQNPFTAKFEPKDPDKALPVNIANDLFLYEKDRGNWDKEEIMFLVSGMVYKGVAELTHDYNTSEYGNLSWMCHNPMLVWEDPNWTSSNIRDLQYLFKAAWMTAEQIKDRFKKKNDEIQSAIDSLREGGIDYDDTIQKSADRTADFYDNRNGQYRVIEMQYLVSDGKWIIMDMDTGKELAIAGENVRQALITDNPERYKRIFRKECVAKTISICPALGHDLILSEGDHPVQVGHLPWFFWSYKDLWGERQGLVDLLHDAQTTMNKRESSFLYWEQMAANGSNIIDVTMFPDEQERRRLQEDMNKPGQSFMAEGNGRSIREAVAPITRGEMPDHLLTGSDRMTNFMDQVANTSSVIRGQANGANQTGKHFQVSLSQALVPFETLNATLQTVWHERAEAFLVAARTFYAGPPMRIRDVKTGRTLYLNKRSYTQEGEPIIENDVSELKRYDVMIIQSNQGAVKRQQFLEQTMQMLQLITNPLARSFIESKLPEYMDISEEDREAFRAVSAKALMLQDAQVDAQLAQLKGQPSAEPKEVAQGAGQGAIPDMAGVMGSANVANNVQRQAPSDMGSRTTR